MPKSFDDENEPLLTNYSSRTLNTSHDDENGIATGPQLTRITRATQFLFGHTTAADDLSPPQRHYGVIQKAVIYGLAFFTLMSWYLIFALLAGELMGEGVPTTLLQTFGETIGTWIHTIGVATFAYCLSIEPMIWKNAHALAPTGDFLYDLFYSQVHTHGMLKYAMFGPTQHTAHHAAPRLQSNNPLLSATGPLSIQFDDSGTHQEQPTQIAAATLGALYGSVRYILYTILAPLAAVPGVSTTFLQEAGIALSLWLLKQMRIGGYAGAMLALAVQASHFYLTPANSSFLRGSVMSVICRGATETVAAVKAILQYFLPNWFSTEDLMPTNTPLSAATLITALIALPLGVTYRLLLFVVAATALIPGLATNYAYFRGLVLGPEANAEIRLGSLPFLLQAAEIEIGRAVTAPCSTEVKPGHVTPGLITEEGGLVNAAAQSVAHPYSAVKHIYRAVRENGMSLWSTTRIDTSEWVEINTEASAYSSSSSESDGSLNNEVKDFDWANADNADSSTLGALTG